MKTEILPGIKACVFDAYGTLFDFNSAVNRCKADIGEKADDLSRIWREKCYPRSRVDPSNAGNWTLSAGDIRKPCNDFWTHEGKAV
jgi:FMN phosphatase YigB (HAD superfamily)